MAQENYQHLSSKELRSILDTELKKKSPNFGQIKQISEILSGRDSNSSESQSNEQKVAFTKSEGDKKVVFETSASAKSHAESKLPKKSLGERIRGAQSRKSFRYLVLAILVSAFYTGAWFFRLSMLDSSHYSEHFLVKLFFGNFGLMTVFTYSIFFVLWTNYRSTENYVRSNLNKTLSILLFTSILDLNLLVLDFSYWIASTNFSLLILLVVTSLLIKFYAYTRLFAHEESDNLFMTRSLGIVSRLTDYQFIVYIFSAILMIILSISAVLVSFYDIDSSKFLFAFLLPFIFVFVSFFFVPSFFDMRKKVEDKFGLFFKILYPILTFVLSIIVIPTAVVFFLIHAFFLFKKLFEIELFDNPTFTLSQIYIGVATLTLVAYMALKVLKPFKIHPILNKVLKFNVVFHISYALMGVVFAFIGMMIRITNAGLTNNRILAISGLVLEFILLAVTLVRIFEFKNRTISVTEDNKNYNFIFKIFYITPILFLVINWLVVGVFRYDQKNTLDIIKSDQTYLEYQIGCRYSYKYETDERKCGNGDYFYNSIETDLNSRNNSNWIYSDNYPSNWDSEREYPTDKINKYTKDATRLGQLFVVFNFGNIEAVKDYEIDQDIKDFFVKYSAEFGSDQKAKDYAYPSESVLSQCHYDLYNSIDPNSKSINSELKEIMSTWSLYGNGSFSKDGSSWRNCIDGIY